MLRSELLARIGAVCGEVALEKKPARLLKLLAELADLLRQYRGVPSADRAPPERSNYADEAELYYKPTEVDIEWAQRLITVIKHNGVAVFPSAGLTYLVDHHQKTLTLVNPERLEVFSAFTTHRQSIIVFKQVGYRVVEIGKE